MSIFDIGLAIAGMPQAQIDALDKAMPGMARVAEAFRQLEPLITKAGPHLTALEPLWPQAQPHFDALMPIILQAYPIMVKAWPDIVSVSPSTQQLIEFISSKG